MESDQRANLVWCPGTHTAPESGYLTGLRIVQGRVDLDLAGREIPTDFLEANHAISTGCREKAGDILVRLADEDLELLETAPVRTDLLFYLGKLWFETGQWEQARECLSKVLSIEPHPIVHYQLAETYLPDLRYLSKALEHMQQAVALCPHNAFLLDQLGHCLFQGGRAHEAVLASEQAVALQPDNPQLLERLLWRLNYVPQTTRQTLLGGYQRWGRLVQVPPGARTLPLVRQAEGPLRVGLLSPDFCRGSAVLLMEPFISAYDRQAFAVFGYGHVDRPDGTTERLKKRLDGYHSVYGLGAEAIAELIRADGIDILIHVGGHCRDNRLDVVALQPAPIQVEYGGIGTAGLAGQTFRLGDEWIDPPDSLAGYVEKTIYLAGGQPMFAPPEQSPLVTPLPARSRGHLTFGSFNNQSKINDQCLDLWARVLRTLPDARLVLKFPAAHDLGVQRYFRERLETLGVQPERIQFVGQLSHYAYLSQIGEVDLILDTYPFNGCVTTMEALWMGVPVVTLKGDTFVSRMGYAIMRRLGLDRFVADDEQAFVAKACHFASRLGELEQIRAGLRERFLASPVLDPKRYTQDLSDALNTIHRLWRGQSDSGPIDVNSTACEPNAQEITAY